MKHTGKAGLIEHRALGILSGLYGSPSEILAEFIDNSLDANASKVWIVLRPDQITVIDDGHGMVALILDRDRPVIEEFRDQVDQGPLRDIRNEVSPTSRSSLEWLMEFAAFSAKLPQAGDRTRGARGIGVLGARQLGNHTVWVTRPDLELARECWGEGSEEYHNPPTFQLTPPSAEDVEWGKLGYEIITAPSRLTDPYRNQLQSGTQVEISGLRPGIEPSLRPAALASFFSNRFSEDLRERLELVLIDLWTEEGKKTRGGKTHLVRPTLHSGVPLIEEEVSLGPCSFRVELFYDPSGHGARPMLVRKGTRVRPLTELEYFNLKPWNTGKVTGPVEYPNVDESVGPWSADKTTPLPSSLTNKWVKAVRDLEARIEAAIAEIESRAKARQIRDISDGVREALIGALEDLDAFEGVKLGKPTTKNGGKKKPPVVPTNVTVRVLNQFGRGVPNVAIELRDSSRPPVAIQVVTGKAGNASFGLRPAGRYFARIVVPSGMVSPGSTEYRFLTSEDRPGHRVVFRLEDPDAAAPPSLRGLNFQFRPWSDTDEIWRFYPESGILEINTEAPDFREALDSGDKRKQQMLLALYSSMAISQHAFQAATIKEVLHHAGRLFSATLSRIPTEKTPRKTRSKR